MLGPEFEKKWVTVSASPTNVPIGARPISIVPKTAVVEGVIVITGYRLITDGSYPDKLKRNAHVRDEDGVLKPLAPNFNFAEGSQPDVRYTSIAEISVALQPLMAAAEQAQTTVVLKCYDFAKWFRQIYMCNLDRWQIVETWTGLWFNDMRVTMGCIHSSNTGQRVSYVILNIVEVRLDKSFEALLASCSGPEYDAVRAWRARRMVLFPNQPEQWRIYHISSYQDDSPTAVLKLFEKWFDDIMTAVLKELRVPLSGKEGDFDVACEAIGGAFVLRPDATGSVGPAEETETSFRVDAAIILENDIVEWEMFDSFKGKFEWANRFLIGGQRRCSPAYKCMRQARRKVGRKSAPTVEVSSALRNCVLQTLEMLAGPSKGSFRPMIRDPHFLHGGLLVAGDASTKDGWGAHVGGLVTGLLWKGKPWRQSSAVAARKSMGRAWASLLWNWLRKRFCWLLLESIASSTRAKSSKWCSVVITPRVLRLWLLVGRKAPRWKWLCASSKRWKLPMGYR